MTFAWIDATRRLHWPGKPAYTFCRRYAGFGMNALNEIDMMAAVEGGAKLCNACKDLREVARSAGIDVDPFAPREEHFSLNTTRV